MAIFTGGKSTAIESPRHLTLRHALRAVKINRNEPQEEWQPDLNPGEEQLYSFWAPSLTAGQTHRITAQQLIDSEKQGEIPLQLDAEKTFKVEAPRYSLPADSIYSVYPPSGYSEEHRILPHVVLRDPHLPWERRGSLWNETPSRRVPWLALLLFKQEELQLPAEDRNGDASLFPPTTQPVKQTASMAVRMTLGDLQAVQHVQSPVTETDASSNQTTMADFIFIQPHLFTSLFSPFSKSNQSIPGPKPDASPYQFLSHVRKINTTGMAVAGTEDVGVFGIVVANRSGPLDNTKATTVSVHLVSIEGVEDNIKFPLASDTKYVALCSLHSWNYTVLPPDMLNVPNAFNSLGQTLGLLRPPHELIDPIRRNSTPDTKAVSDRLATRLKEGYSMVRHRTQTGEITVALFRGPFTPTAVRRRWTAPKDSDSDLHRCSNSGIDLQILDRHVGIMDISYSVAWQVGRMLALADQAFTTALLRLRTAIHHKAMAKAKEAVLLKRSQSAFVTRGVVLERLPEICKQLAEISGVGNDNKGEEEAEEENTAFYPRRPSKRWDRRSLSKKELPSLRSSSSEIKKEYPQAAIDAAFELAKSTDGTIYDETNQPVSTDWMIVLAWVMNRMFLDGVPSHYLITDPSHLEPERLRFFHIDANWTDALIDGALSLGNHQGEDRDRVAIKRGLNQYIHEKPELLAHPPQIPTYGFYLRSDLVSMYPDLKVTTLPELPGRAPLLRHEIIADGVMLALLDRIPGSDQFNGLVFTQPPHQQRFSVADTLAKESITISMKRQYTVDQKDRPQEQRREPLDVTLPSQRTDQDHLFIWGSEPDSNDLHMLRLPRYADLQLHALQTKMGTFVKHGVENPYFTDTTTTSSLLAQQLTDPTYRLVISLTSPGAERALSGIAAKGDGSDVRTLSLLAPSRVNRAAMGFQLDPPSDSEDPGLTTASETDDETVLANVTFDRADSIYTEIETEPAEGQSQPPSQPASAIVTGRAIRRNDSRPAGPPEYICKVFSVGSGNVYVDEDNLPQDLIFSIKVENNNSSYYKIRAFHIWIELGQGIDGSYRLLANYNGPGPSMLSNVRFNALPKFVKQANSTQALKLSLFPRSRTQHVDITLVQEMSFILGLAQVNMCPGKYKQLWIDWQADYHGESQRPQKGRSLVTVRRKEG